MTKSLILCSNIEYYEFNKKSIRIDFFDTYIKKKYGIEYFKIYRIDYVFFFNLVNDNLVLILIFRYGPIGVSNNYIKKIISYDYPF